MLHADALCAVAGASGLTFSAQPGRCTGLVAAAPETLIEVLAGLRPAASGRITRDVTTHRIAVMCVATSAMDPRLTAREYLDAVAACRRTSAVALRRPVEDVLSALAIDGRARLAAAPVRRAVALAAALLPAVPLVLLADPLHDLAPASRTGAIEWIQALAIAAEPATLVASFLREGDARAVSHHVIHTGRPA